jgi:hypothetical protein
MRVISLTDGRVCYVKPARSKKELPPGQVLALAGVPGQPRVALQLPEQWASMNEAELRQRVEASFRERREDAARPAPGTVPRPGTEGDGPARPRGFFARLFRR